MAETDRSRLRVRQCCSWFLRQRPRMVRPSYPERPAARQRNRRLAAAGAADTISEPPNPRCPMAALRTPLYDWHVAHKGRMVEFGGWMLPVQYTGIVEEHKAVRSAGGLFDISHMGRLSFGGA